MSSNEFLQLLSYGEILLCAVALFFLIFRGQWRQYWALGLLLAVRVSTSLFLLSALYLSGKGVEKHLAYQVYFYGYWVGFAIQVVLTLVVIYSAFRLVLDPLRGLQRLGSRIFWGIAVLGVALAAVSLFSPYLSGTKLLVAAITELQQLQAILTLCLVLFVLGVARAVGLSYRSTVFGVIVGLGILAAMSLVVSVWLAHSPEMYPQFNIANAVAVMAVMGLWAVYMALPERGRSTVDLPADSRLARWNRTCLTWTGGV